jgi:hypothetical protein
MLQSGSNRKERDSFTPRQRYPVHIGLFWDFENGGDIFFKVAVHFQRNARRYIPEDRELDLDDSNCLRFSKEHSFARS